MIQRSCGQQLHIRQVPDHVQPRVWKEACITQRNEGERGESSYAAQQGAGANKNCFNIAVCKQMLFKRLMSKRGCS